MDAEGNYIEDPKQILNKRLDFNIIIESAELFDNFCTNALIKYSIFNENYETKPVK